MKSKLILFAFCFISLVSIAQKKEFEDPIYTDTSNKKPSSLTELSNFFLENGNVIYIRIYDMNNTNSQEIFEKLNTYLPTVVGISNIAFNGNVFTGNIDNLLIDYKKYGGKIMTAWTALNNPMFAKLTIQIKDNRYRVVITDIRCVHQLLTYDFNSCTTEKDRTSFINKKILLQGLGYVDSYFSELFTIKNDKISDEW